METFGDNYAIVTFEWSGSVSTTYSVTAEPSVVSIVMTGSTTVEIIVTYNSLHNVKVVAMSCGGNTTTFLRIIYGKHVTSILD